MTQNHFVVLIRGIQRYIPMLSLIYIFVTYIVTALISIYFLKLPTVVTVFGALVIQIGRMTVVFMDFLYLTKSRVFATIAIILTGLAMLELYYSLGEYYSGAQFLANYIFLCTIIVLGLAAEIIFIEKARKVVLTEDKKEAEVITPEVPPKVKSNTRRVNFQKKLKSEVI
jgi:hypothetical protein